MFETVDKSFFAQEFATYCDEFTKHEELVWKPQFVVLHNTAVPTYAQWNKVPGATRMKNLEHYYRDVEKWHEGPHLFIADKIWIFTPLSMPGVHSPSWNKISWGVELVGDYEIESLSDTVRLNAVAALVALHKLGQINPVTMKLHREDPLTTHACPGHNIHKETFISWILADTAKTGFPMTSPNTDSSVKLHTPLKNGDLVQLVSGGPTMTVTDVGSETEHVRCSWTDGDKVKASVFAIATLRQVTASGIKNPTPKVAGEGNITSPETGAKFGFR
jgi:uncharacterized protein YodC (DUF2158 family)